MQTTAALVLLASLCCTMAGCTAQTYWYNPNPQANLETDQKLSQEEAKQARLTDYDEYSYLQGMSRAGMVGAQQGFAATLASSLAVQRDMDARLRRAQERAYYEAMARRGWRLVSYKDAVALGLVKPAK